MDKPEIDFDKLKEFQAKKNKPEQKETIVSSVGHEVKVIENDVAFYRWQCSCGASSAGQWYSSLEKAMKRANVHKSSALTDPYYNRRGLINVRDFDEWP